MDTNVNYTIVGVFVLTLLTAIIITIIWLSSGLSFEHYKKYLIFSKESVSGLTVDSTVEYNGVSVGSVEVVSIDQHNPHIVRVLISIDQTTPITRGTVAMITSRGVTGVAYVALKDTGKDLRPLHSLQGEDYPIIPSTPSIFVRLDYALTKLTKNFDNIAQGLTNLLDKKNLESISHTLSNIDEITTSLAVSSDKLTTIIDNTSKASEKLSPLFDHGSSTMKLLDTQTLPALQQSMSNMNILMQNLTDLSQQLKQNPSVLIRGSSPPPLGPGERR